MGAAALATPAFAATIVSFSPGSVSVNPGQSFNLTINVDAQAVKNYTVKVELRFPADLLEINSFTFGASGWMAWNQAGYDLTDNTNGVLIKTAGYPGGFGSAATFGTVSFKAKKAGKGTIKVGSGTIVLDANNQNVFSGTPEVAFTVTAPAPVAPKKPAIETPVPTPSQGEEVTVPVPEQPVEQPIAQPIEQPVAQVAAKTSLIAAIGGILTLGTDSVWVGILVGLIILAIVVYAIYTLIQKKRKNI